MFMSQHEAKSTSCSSTGVQLTDQSQAAEDHSEFVRAWSKVEQCLASWRCADPSSVRHDEPDPSLRETDQSSGAGGSPKPLCIGGVIHQHDGLRDVADRIFPQQLVDKPTYEAALERWI